VTTREGVDAGCDATSGDEGDTPVVVDPVASRLVVFVGRGRGRGRGLDGGCASAVGAAV